MLAGAWFADLVVLINTGSTHRREGLPLDITIDISRYLSLFTVIKSGGSRITRDVIGNALRIGCQWVTHSVFEFRFHHHLPKLCQLFLGLGLPFLVASGFSVTLLL